MIESCNLKYETFYRYETDTIEIIENLLKSLSCQSNSLTKNSEGLKSRYGQI